MTVPGPADYYNSDLNVLDTNRLYILSFKGFPHHAVVSESRDGGNAWNVILDTNDLFVTDFVVFDTNRMVAIRTSNHAFTTDNSGGHWQDIMHGLPISSCTYKVNDSTVIIGGNENEEISYSTDRGLDWDPGYFVQSPPIDFWAKTLDTVYAVTQGATGTFFLKLVAADGQIRFFKIVKL